MCILFWNISRPLTHLGKVEETPHSSCHNWCSVNSNQVSSAAFFLPSISRLSYYRSQGNPIAQSFIATELTPETELALIEPLGLTPTEPASHMLQEAGDGKRTWTSTSIPVEYVTHTLHLASFLIHSFQAR